MLIRDAQNRVFLATDKEKKHLGNPVLNHISHILLKRHTGDLR